MIVNGKYVSLWDEGNVETPCKVNVNTGEITNIIASEDCDHLEHLIREFVLIGNCEQFELEVEDCELTEHGSECLFIIKQENMEDL